VARPAAELVRGRRKDLDNWEVAAALERMAGLLALKGENSYKIKAYSQAARQIIRLPEPLADLITEEASGRASRDWPGALGQD